MERKSPNVFPQVVRLNRFIAMSGVASRRKAEELIRTGAVEINGRTVTDLATKVAVGHDRVVVNGEAVSLAEKLIYILLNKPKDYITTAHDERGRKTVFDLLHTRERVFPVGRLDRNTTGVLLFTNDGHLANRLMHPSFQVRKSYFVTLTEGPDDKDLKKLREGVFLEDGKTAPAEIESLPGTKKRKLVVTIREGRNRQVRRMFEVLGYDVKSLDRIEYAGVTAHGLRRGKWRFLNSQEISKVKHQCGLHS